ncbi:hypothetical protein F2Q69_00002250 [Brassica cretica]|uniref:Uncharacterized protein n=2 Tax=Brassica TaxID=3705 RepID=A0A0D3B6P4_BRAOL|nr:hypothetical protein F2Q69_00002250 [Brassica cretica]
MLFRGFEAGPEAYASITSVQGRCWSCGYHCPLISFGVALDTVNEFEECKVPLWDRSCGKSWKPYVQSPKEFSLGQTWVVLGNGSSLNTIEAGFGRFRVVAEEYMKEVEEPVKLNNMRHCDYYLRLFLLRQKLTIFQYQSKTLLNI